MTKQAILEILQDSEIQDTLKSIFKPNTGATKTVSQCDRCGSIYQPFAKFCGHCGSTQLTTEKVKV